MKCLVKNIVPIMGVISIIVGVIVTKDLKALLALIIIMFMVGIIEAANS